jgi:lipopolysaccharide export system protein LptA
MRRTRCFAFLAAALMASTCTILPASAQTEAESRISGLRLNGGDPIQIESDKLEVREEDNLAVFTGNVTVNQGPTLLKAGRMVVHYAKDGGSAATGSSNIEKLEVDQKVYVKSDNQIATGDSGVFDMKTEVLVMSGNKVVLTEGSNVLTGCKLTVQMKTGRAQVDGCSNRVQMKIDPGSTKN